jgi:aquaporin Z
MNKFLAEFTGTAIMVFLGCGAMVIDNVYGGVLTHLGVALVWGLVVMMMIYSIGNVSGAHMNPAVTITFFIAKKFSKKELIPYLAAQITGAILGALLIKSIFPSLELYGNTLISDKVSIFGGFFVEVILSFILMFVILNISTGHKEKGIMAGVAVGTAVALDAAVGGPITNASMNPARTIGPAIISGNYSNIWVYMIAPFIGMALALPVVTSIQKDGYRKAGSEE